MNIIDNNAIIYVLDRNIRVTEDYFLAPDVKEESELAELRSRRNMPVNFKEIRVLHSFTEPVYLGYYKVMLNKYGGRSFFNMAGFGDISILATVYTLLDNFELAKQQTLFPDAQEVAVFTEDARLIKKIRAEFAGKNVVVMSLQDIR